MLAARSDAPCVSAYVIRNSILPEKLYQLFNEDRHRAWPPPSVWKEKKGTPPVDGSAKAQIRSAACPFFFPFVLGFGAPEPEHEEKDLGSGLCGGSTRVCRWGRTTCFFLTNSIVFTIFGRCLCTPLRSVASLLLRREATVQLVGEHGDVHDLLQSLFESCSPRLPRGTSCRLLTAAAVAVRKKAEREQHNQWCARPAASLLAVTQLLTLKLEARWGWWPMAIRLVRWLVSGLVWAG